jgi:hypothetical protein
MLIMSPLKINVHSAATTEFVMTQTGKEPIETIEQAVYEVIIDNR